MAPWGWPALLLLLLAGLGDWAGGATLLPRRPGHALALNGRTNTEYAYSYPRRLTRAFTVEMWLRGGAQAQANVAYFSVSHPRDDNVLAVTDVIKLLSVKVLPTPVCPSAAWCHLAVAVDLTAYPTYRIATYLNGYAAQNATGQLNSVLTPADIEQPVLSFVLGQEQDSQLGDFDTAQIFSGHLDELRLWDTVRTAEEVATHLGLVLTPPFPDALVSYYTFDDADWNATHYEDQVNASEQHRFYSADYANSSTDVSRPPAYSPPRAPPPRLALSSAPLCAADATRGRLAVRVGPAGGAAVPVAALYCAAAAAEVTGTVTAVVGGEALADGRPAVGVALNCRQSIAFQPTGSDPAAGAGFSFTVTDGAASASGFVAVLPNSAPTLPSNLTLLTDEDVAVTIWVIVTDTDRDVVQVAVFAAPVTGEAVADGSVNRTVQYTPPPDANGVALGWFELQALDMWGAVSNAMLVEVSVKPVQDPPRLYVNPTFTIYRGQRVAIPFRTVDVDGDDPFLIVSDWPAAAEGALVATDKGQTWTINEGAVASSKMQWASSVGNYSTMYARHLGAEYSVTRLLGAPQCAVRYADCPDAWCPSSLNGGCVNRANAAEALATFYTEFFEVAFPTAVYVNDVILVENWGGDRVSRVLVPSDRDPTKWKAIMTKDIADTAVSAAVTKYGVSSLRVCQVMWPVNRVRIEADTCHRTGWYEVDAVQIRGGVVPAKNVLNTTAMLMFQALPSYTGNVTFSLTATTCYGSFDATSNPLFITVEVLDPPNNITVEAKDGWSVLDVCPPPCGLHIEDVVVLELPTQGYLRCRGIDLTAVQEDLGSSTTAFEYLPFRCSPQLTDMFLVQLGPTTVVQVNVQGCATAQPLLVAIAVPSVLAAVALAVLGVLLARHRRHRRDNSRAPRDPGRDLCVVFTDIQASTLLWGEVPHIMAAALDAHHAIIRRLITKHKCYEVKTIGDSFMIASVDPVAAIQLALNVQEALFHHGWEGAHLDEVYRRHTDCRLSPTAYAARWRGLRVRIGINYGRVQINFDKTTKGYDYYGPVVNAAARIEGVAHGGQILLSREAFAQVADYCAAPSVVVQPLGLVHLRDLPAPLDLVQVLPARFALREFPPLRTDRDGRGPPCSPLLVAAEGADGRGDPELGSACSSSQRPWPDAAASVTGSQFDLPFLYPQALDREVLAHPLVRSGAVPVEQAVFHVYDVYYALKSLLNMHKKAAERRKKLRELCKQWHVPCRADTEEQENATVGKLAMQLLGSVVTQLHASSKQGALTPSSPRRLEGHASLRFMGSMPVHPLECLTPGNGSVRTPPPRPQKAQSHSVDSIFPGNPLVLSHP